MLTNKQVSFILEIGFKSVGKKYEGLNCSSFVKKIYETVGIFCNFSDFPVLNYDEIFIKDAIGNPIFLHRKDTKSTKRITHIGIIFPDKHVLHYSRRISGEFRPYKVYLSSFEDIFKIYDFVDP